MTEHLEKCYHVVYVSNDRHDARWSEVYVSNETDAERLAIIDTPTGFYLHGVYEMEDK